MPDIRINPSARLAFSQGRMHREGAPDKPLPAAYDRMHMCGWTFERLSTFAQCSTCYSKIQEKANKTRTACSHMQARGLREWPVTLSEVS